MVTCLRILVEDQRRCIGKANLTVMSLKNEQEVKPRPATPWRLCEKGSGSRQDAFPLFPGKDVACLYVSRNHPEGRIVVTAE